jgi:hypothetical protein
MKLRVVVENHHDANYICNGLNAIILEGEPDRFEWEELTRPSSSYKKCTVGNRRRCGKCMTTHSGDCPSPRKNSAVSNEGE